MSSRSETGKSAEDDGVLDLNGDEIISHWPDDAESHAERLLCETHVSHHMSTDTDDRRDGDEMTKIDVRVPEQLITQIDEKYEERGYTSRSEAIRDALRAWIDPPVRLSDEILEDLATSREQRERGETRSLDEVADKYGVDIDEE